MHSPHPAPVELPDGTTAARELCVALVGRQNSGKTSLLMHLTGSAQRPVNFPGSSVERLEASTSLDDGRNLRVVDLPGIVSLTTASPDEEIALDYLQGEAPDSPDVICAVLDAAKLTVELHLLEFLATFGRPVVIALNKVDKARKHGGAPVLDVLRRRMRVPIVETNGFKGLGIDDLREAFVAAAAQPALEPGTKLYDGEPDDIVREALGLTADCPAAPNHRTSSDRIDRVLLHRVFGLPILALVMFITFQLVFTVAEPFTGLVESGQELVTSWFTALIPPGALQSFAVDGLVNGVGSVLVFLPQIALLIAFVTILEATGYMARAAFLLDRALRRVGLSGRSFLPLTTSFACAIPGILATRIIDDERDRLATVIVAPLMSCSARLPVYVVLIGAFFPAAWAGLMLFSLYLFGILVAAFVAWALRRTVLAGGASTLMMELPSYQQPSVRVVARQTWNACTAFVRMAGTVIFATAVIIWALSYYPRPAAIHERFEAERQAVVAADSAERETLLERLDHNERYAYLEQSILARVGKFVQPAFEPVGFDWRTTVGVLASFPARELIIPTLGVLYSLGDVDAGDFDLDELDGVNPQQLTGLRHKLVNARDESGNPTMSPLIALSILVFFALCSQCAATLGAIRRETHSWKWPIFTFVYMTGLAYGASVAVIQIGRALGYN